MKSTTNFLEVLKVEERRQEFLKSLREGVNNQSRTIKKIQIFQLIDDHPEVLNSLTLEQLKKIEQYYEEDLKKIRNSASYN